MFVQRFELQGRLFTNFYYYYYILCMCFQGKAIFDLQFADKVGNLQKLNVAHLRELCRVCRILASNLNLVKNGSAQCLPRRESSLLPLCSRYV